MFLTVLDYDHPDSVTGVTEDGDLVILQLERYEFERVRDYHVGDVTPLVIDDAAIVDRYGAI
jgi:hypothetical protein